MILENCLTERLRFRRLTPSDQPQLLAFFSDAHATEYLYLPDNLEAHTEEWIARQIRRYDNGSGGLFAIELQASGELIGQCGLVRQFVDGIPKWEVGYHLFRRHWGKGYATEAAIACRDFCFENEMAETLISLIHPDHFRSMAVAARNGMTHWKDTIFKDQQSQVFRIRREDWESMGLAVGRLEYAGLSRQA